MTRIRWVVAIVTTFVLGLSIVLAVALSSSDPETSNPLVGDAAPNFNLVDFDGNQLRLSDLRGKVVLINFWNEWCVPCIEETPSLVALADARKTDENFVMVGIVHDERKQSETRKYATDKGMRFPLAFDPDSRTGLNYSVTGQPETFVVDRKGVVRSWISGPIAADQIDTLIARLEAES